MGFNGTQYVNNVMPQVLEWREENLSGEISDYFLVEDNSCPHRAEKSKTFCVEQGLEKVMLAGKSPDMNPIETFWVMLKDIIARIWQRVSSRSMNYFTGDHFSGREKAENRRQV